MRRLYTYNNIVYVTEDDGVTAVTCYALRQLPISEATLNAQMLRQIAEQKSRVSVGAMDITSHTILVVDQSASMNQSDVMGHRSRSRCLFYTIANEMIAAPLIRGVMSYTDVVTVIEMRTTASIVNGIYMEPITWELHNKIVALASEEQSLRGKGHGNYIPAIEMVQSIFARTGLNHNCPINFFFLSDGRPSDMTSLGKSPEDVLASVRRISALFGKRLTVGTFGFAHDNGKNPFEVLTRMADTARSNGAKAMFSSGFDTQSLRQALSTMTTSLITSRTAMSSLAGGTLMRPSGAGKVKRSDIIKDITSDDEGVFNPMQYNFYMEDGQEELIRMVAAKWEKKDRKIKFKDIGLMHPEARGIAMKKAYLEKGAERITYYLTEVDKHLNPIGRPLVGKISLNIEPEQLEFHEHCARTQLEARRISKKFNDKLKECGIDVPPIEFLQPSFYVWYTAPYHEKQIHAILAEQRLDHTRYKKWNDNKGGIDTLLAKVIPLNVNELPDIEDTEENTDSDSDAGVALGDVTNEPHYNKILDEDVPQAFSHWTYQYTKGDSLVCDLQGVLTSSFNLTDPAIHSSRRRFGYTDHGKKGMASFFQTHKCNSLCKTLKLRTPSLKPR